MSFDAMLYDWPEHIVSSARNLRIRMDFLRQRSAEGERAGNPGIAAAYASSAYAIEEELIDLLAKNDPPVPVLPCGPRSADQSPDAPDPNAEPPLWIVAQMEQFRRLARSGPQRKP